MIGCALIKSLTPLASDASSKSLDLTLSLEVESLKDNFCLLDSIN